jgi:type I restriction enzyme M protein
MFGAIIGDLVGSVYEFNNYTKKDFPFFGPGCFPTDDSLMTIAVAKAILDNDGATAGLGRQAVKWMQKIGRQYPECGFGTRFFAWMFCDDPQPYNSFGNGSAMRVSPCGFAAKSLSEAIALARAVTVVSHDHPEGIKGAEATACAVYLARTGSTKQEIREFITENYYALDFTLDEIRPYYHLRFDETCQGSVPQAIEAFLESVSFEDAIRNAISVGGDSDTLAAITGSIAEAFYGIPDDLREQAIRQFKLGCTVHYPRATAKKDPDLLSVVEQFEQRNR